MTMCPVRLNASSGLSPAACAAGAWCGGRASSRSRKMAWTGQAAAARTTFGRCASSGAGAYSNASSPRMVNTSGAANAHCAYPWHRVRSTTTCIKVSVPLKGSELFQ